MSQLPSSDYHFCTLNELQSPKQLPSLDFVAKLVDICHVPMTLFQSSQRNIYDRKNHILYINNVESYARALGQKYSRSVLSFEKQLKMMGFKKRKSKQPQSQFMQTSKQLPSQQLQKNQSYEGKQESKRDTTPTKVLVEQQSNIRDSKGQILQTNKQMNSQSKYMYVWRTNRSALIERQLATFQETLSSQISKAISLREQMQKRKRQLDAKLEAIIFQSLLNNSQSEHTEIQNEVTLSKQKQSKKRPESETILQNNVNDAVKELRMLSNQCQLHSKQLVKGISKNMACKLQIYRMLIYKQTHVHTSIDQE